MQDRIGELAGYVWRVLEDEGESSFSALADAVDAPRSKVSMAIGWLAREDKIEFREEGRGSKISLK